MLLYSCLSFHQIGRYLRTWFLCNPPGSTEMRTWRYLQQIDYHCHLREGLQTRTFTVSAFACNLRICQPPKENPGQCPLSHQSCYILPTLVIPQTWWPGMVTCWYRSEREWTSRARANCWHELPWTMVLEEAAWGPYPACPGDGKRRHWIRGLV